MKSLDRKGHFRVTIESYGFEKAKDSGAHCVLIKCLVLEQYDFDAGEWQDWRNYEEHEVWGRIWIIKKDGKVNATAAESLMKNAGWDGDIMSIQNQTWQPHQCSVSVEESEYNGKISYKVGFVNGYDDTPSGKLGNVDELSARQLSATYGASFRALAGSAKQNASKPNGKPTAPPARTAEPSSVGSGIPADEVPFACY